MIKTIQINGNLQMNDLLLQYFSLKVKNPEKPVAPGLEVPAIVEYVTQEAKEHKDRLVLTVDDDIVEIPLIG